MTVFSPRPCRESNAIHQFGIQPNPELTARFSESSIPDDPPVACSGAPGHVECRAEAGASRTTGIKRGMVVYAGSGADSRASDLFLVRADSEHLGGDDFFFF